MARGLSDLQKTMLRILAESDSAERFWSNLHVKVYTEYYGWTPLRGYRGWDFSRQAIGEKEYQAAHAAVSRAMRRLESRGLISPNHASTDAGRAMAEKLIEDRLLEEGWSEEEIDLRRRLLAGETVVYSVSKDKRKAPHRHFHEWAEANGHAVYIGREVHDRRTGEIRFEESDWNNRNPVRKHGREKAISLYYEDLLNNPKLLARVLPELKGKALGCWCAPDPCHGDVLKTLADALPAPATAA